MTDLIERLSAATEGSRELDAEIAVAVRCMFSPTAGDLPEWVDKNFPNWVVTDGGRVACEHSNGKHGLNWAPPKFTTSIDASIDGENIEIVIHKHDGKWFAMHVDGSSAFSAVAATEPLARRCASLKAIKQGEE